MPDSIESALSVLTFARFTFRIRARTPLILPPFKGSTLRGVLGWGLAERFCERRRDDICHCPPEARCAYGVLSGKAADDRAKERPCVLEVPPIAATEIAAGEAFDVGITLIGDTVGLLPHLVEALHYASERFPLGDPGEGHGLWIVERLWQRRFGAAPRALDVSAPAMSAVTVESVADMPYPQSLPPDGSVVGLSFLTPTHLRHTPQGRAQRTVKQPDFGRVARKLIERCEHLTSRYGGARLVLDYAGLYAEADEVAVLVDETRYCELRRYSNSQRAEVPVEGFVGDVYYGGRMAPFVRLLQLGEVVHVGKDTAMGLGQYRVIDGWMRVGSDALAALYGRGGAGQR